jgi:RNA polymerase sigma-70 factor (ECF subfamily)
LGGGEISAATLDACRRGDREAFRALYEAYTDRVYSIALHFFRGDADAAAEVTQQVFLKMLREISRFRGDAALSTWLYRLTVNACVDRTRRNKVTAPADPAVLDTLPSGRGSVEEFLSMREQQGAIRAAVASLPTKLKAAILLRYFDDLSYADMAVALNCSIGTVASRLSRGHRLLARQLSLLRQGEGKR